MESETTREGGEEVGDRITVAAVQIRSVRGDVAGNLDHATEFIERAVAQRARLVVLPELHATGYEGTRSIWDVAEPADGPIGRWVADTAGRLGVYLGCGMAEIAGSDCFNSFVWAGPDGKPLGVTRKTSAEAYMFRRGRGAANVIDTPIGRIGVGICADNQRMAHLRLMARANVDLVVMPHAAPMSAGPSRLADEADVAAQHERMRALPVLYAKALGVPVVFADQVGDFGGLTGVYGKLMSLVKPRLLGLSRIVDSDGRVVAELGTDEGLAVADVVLDPARKIFRPPPDHGGMLFPGSALGRRIIMPIDIGLGELSYRLRTRERMRRFAAGRTT